MKAIRTVLVAILAAGLPMATLGDVIYNVTFENPPHAVNNAVATGAGMPDRPDGTAGSVITRGGVADFATQVASLEPAGIMRFFSSTPSAMGLAVISWDMAVLSFGSGGNPNSAWVYIISGGGGSGVLNMFWQLDNDFVIGDTPVATFTLGKQDHYEFLIDLDNSIYDFSFNGVFVLTNQALNSNFNIQQVTFQAENLQSPSYAIDNFRWEVVPEPSAALLMITGSLAAIYGRRLLKGEK